MPYGVGVTGSKHLRLLEFGVAHHLYVWIYPYYLSLELIFLMSRIVKQPLIHYGLVLPTSLKLLTVFSPLTGMGFAAFRALSLLKMFPANSRFFFQSRTGDPYYQFARVGRRLLSLLFWSRRLRYKLELDRLSHLFVLCPKLQFLPPYLSIPTK